MTNEEAIKILEVAQAECEWIAPLEYQIAFDMAIEALKKLPSAQTEIIRCKNCKYGGYELARPNKYHPCDGAFPAHWRCYYYKKFIPIVSQDGFCSFAERRTNE